jgi:Ca2+-binding EF-hand superfamily protein
VQAQTTPNPADEAKFKSADKNGNGTLEGAETDAFKASMTQIDTNKDGKITREEFLAASKSGVVK